MPLKPRKMKPFVLLLQHTMHASVYTGVILFIPVNLAAPLSARLAQTTDLMKLGEDWERASAELSSTKRHKIMELISGAQEERKRREGRRERGEERYRDAPLPPPTASCSSR